MKKYLKLDPLNVVYVDGYNVGTPLEPMLNHSQTVKAVETTIHGLASGWLSFVLNNNSLYRPSLLKKNMLIVRTPDIDVVTPFKMLSKLGPNAAEIFTSGPRPLMPEHKQVRLSNSLFYIGMYYVTEYNIVKNTDSLFAAINELEGLHIKVEVLPHLHLLITTVCFRKCTACWGTGKDYTDSYTCQNCGGSGVPLTVSDMVTIAHGAISYATTRCNPKGL